jgi:hypothetical protein
LVQGGVGAKMTGVHEIVEVVDSSLDVVEDCSVAHEYRLPARRISTSSTAGTIKMRVGARTSSP